MICKNCGATLNDNQMFCTQCGGAIEYNNNQTGGVENTTYNTPINEPQYTPPYTSTNEAQYKPSYSAPNNYSDYNPYNNYNNPQGNGNNTGIIIVVAILSAIIFFVIGLFVGRALPKKDSKAPEQKQPASAQTENKPSESNKTVLFQSLTKENATSSTTSYIDTLTGTVTFNIPKTFVEDDEAFSDSEVRHFILNNDDSDLGVYIAEEYGTLSEYLEEIDEKATRYKSYGYRNVSVSDVSFTVNNKTFKGKVLSYDMEYSKFVDAFIAYELSPRTLYAVEIEEYNELSENELTEFLTITVSK